MLQDLHMLQTYFEEPKSIFYEDDLKRQYGADKVRQAIHDGLLDHGWIPCGTGVQRCVCRLSEKGMMAAQS